MINEGVFMKVKYLCLVVLGIFALGCGNAQDLQSRLTNQWILTALSNAGNVVNVRLAEQNAYIDFDTPQDFNGNAGCNGFFGSYQVQANQIRFSNVGMTRKLCAPESMAVEDTLVQLFADGVGNVSIQGSELIITRGTIRAVFRASR